MPHGFACRPCLPICSICTSIFLECNWWDTGGNAKHGRHQPMPLDIVTSACREQPSKRWAVINSCGTATSASFYGMDSSLACFYMFFSFLFRSGMWLAACPPYPRSRPLCFCNYMHRNKRLDGVCHGFGSRGSGTPAPPCAYAMPSPADSVAN